MGGLQDNELMEKVRAAEFTFVTNNAVDFRRLFRHEAIHPGLVILIPNATPSVQRALFSAALEFIGDRDLVNRCAATGEPAGTMRGKLRILPKG